MTQQPPVRTYNARHGPVSQLNQARLETLGPDRSVSPGPLDLERTFGRRAPFVLEIGCGHGGAAIAYAVSHPQHDILALDVHTPGIARMLAAAERAGVANLRIERCDAMVFLRDRVGPEQLDAVHLFFPDPWPKSRHAKRRFVNPPALDLLESQLAPSGHLLIATDRPDYAAYARKQVEAHGAFVASVTERPRWRPTDGFEAKALAAGRFVSELRVGRR